MNRLPLTPVKQEFYNYALSVGTVPTPISLAAQQADLSALIDTMIFSLVSTAARSVFFGGSNVTTGNGWEIRAGKSYMLGINNTRQLYEVQSPLIDMNCNSVPVGIPLAVWDISDCYMVAAATTVCAVLLFKYPLH
jgi:hypothetical protein